MDGIGRWFEGLAGRVSAQDPNALAEVQLQQSIELAQRLETMLRQQLELVRVEESERIAQACSGTRFEQTLQPTVVLNPEPTVAVDATQMVPDVEGHLQTVHTQALQQVTPTNASTSVVMEKAFTLCRHAAVPIRG